MSELQTGVLWETAGHYLPAVVTVASGDGPKQLVTISLPAADLRPGLLTVGFASTDSHRHRHPNLSHVLTSPDTHRAKDLAQKSLTLSWHARRSSSRWARWSCGRCGCWSRPPRMLSVRWSASRPT